MRLNLLRRKLSKLETEYCAQQQAFLWEMVKTMGTAEETSSSSTSSSAEGRPAMQLFGGEDKNLIIEGGNGMGGGHYVREGLDFLDAYAKALGMSRDAFVHKLRNARGPLMSWWRECMTPSELQEIGED